VVELGQKQIIARLNGNSQVSAGDTVKLTFDLSQAVFFDSQSEERIR
jgi:multiple sugar transport system ATP-binding protein